MVNTIIFDMDGVISNTQKIHAEVEAKILNREGINISPEEITRRFSGVRTSEFFIKLLDDKGIKYDIEALMKEKWDKMAAIEKKEIQQIDYSIELIKNLHKKGYKLAVASASLRGFVENVLTSLNIKQYFQSIVTGDDVQKGKPNPESFLKAAQNLNSKSESCIVIEDGRSGMIAAQKAGMQCIALVQDKTEIYPANYVVESLKDAETIINDLIS